jgi:hypothetical protein
VHDCISEIWENNVFCMYSIIIIIMESMSFTVAVLAKGNCTACCQQETNAMFLSHDTSHYHFLHAAQSCLRN